MDNTEAFEAMLAHHRELEQAVATRAAVVVEAAGRNAAYRPAVGELVTYLAEEVLPHAKAEEETVYQVASAHPERAAQVKAMLADHRALALGAEQLAGAADALSAAGQAKEIAASFSAHVAKENGALLPPLLVDDQVDLPRLVTELHRLTETAQHPATTTFPSSADSEEALVSLLLDAAADLTATGQGDRGCQLAAKAWASLRTTRPDLAARVTATLHRLVRDATSEPIQLRVPSAGAQDPDLDVRPFAPAHRHHLIFEAYEGLVPGKGFVLLNDHDPKPLRYQFEAEHPGQFTWDYLEAGPAVWRVRIGRAPEAAASA